MGSPTLIIISLALSLLAIISMISNPSDPSQPDQSQLSVSTSPRACPGPPKSSTIRVYVQDPLQGDNQTVFPVTQSPITPTSPSNFGVIRVADNKVTAGPEYDSQEVGRTQGIVTSADLRVYAISMDVNFYFTTGMYNGSTINILGRNQVFTQQGARELAVVGGTGIFRCARGYATSETYSVDPATRNGVYLYTFYIDYHSNVV